MAYSIPSIGINYQANNMVKVVKLIHCIVRKLIIIIIGGLNFYK